MKRIKFLKRHKNKLLSIEEFENRMYTRSFVSMVLGQSYSYMMCKYQLEKRRLKRIYQIHKRSRKIARAYWDNENKKVN